MANQPTTQEIKDYIVERANFYGVDPKQALALAGVESSYNPNAVSKTGAAGIFQLFPDASKDAGFDYQKVKSDWKTNVNAGISYYKQKLGEAGGSVPMALGYYNQGKGAFTKQLKTGELKPEVKKYITHPAFAEFVDNDLSQAGNPIKPLLSQQANANKWSNAALYRDNIQNQPTQADISANVANPNAPVAQQSDLEKQLRQQRLLTSQQLKQQREEQNQLYEDQRTKNKTKAINDAAVFLTGTILGANNTSTDIKSGEGAGRGSAGAQYGMQTATVLNNLRQQFNPNAFNSRFGG